MNKQCSKCGEVKDIKDFHKRNDSQDGHRNDCAECSCKRWATYRVTTKGKEVVSKAQKRYHATKNGKRQHILNAKRQAERYPKKVKCRKTCQNAVRAGRLIRPPLCSACGQANGVVESHHEDYSQPSNVEWLCGTCHKQLHRKESI